MKKYILTAIVEGKVENVRNTFSSRGAALDYIFNYYSKHGLEDLYISDEYSINDDKHNIEYVCDYDNRFRITRTIA